jgi:thiosulfate reductase cytochrome b subunit
VNASRTGWYDHGTTASFSVPSVEEPMSGLLGILGGVWRFQGWYENGTLLTITKDSIITMNTAHTFVAHWHGDYTFPMIIFGLVFAAASLAIVHFRNRRMPLRRMAGRRNKRTTH